MTMTTYALSLKPVTASTIPTAQEILDAGRAIIETVGSWKAGKTYGAVGTCHRKGEHGGPGWHGRRSEHEASEATFDQLWDAIGKDHFQHEKEYIPAINKVTHIKDVDAGEIWSLHYTFPNPVSPRVFTELQVTFLDTSGPRTGWVVTVPFDVEHDATLKAKQETGVHGKYVSAERIVELDNGKIEWCMATCSTPGGSIPQFVSERAIPAQIAQDVPHLLEWIKKTASQ